ncbi:hypothetical protein PHYSODRAFT_311881 [Phytophthora sojae]|uniref:DDE Tnp4 domain-containing protein n=1 Tax=Phytophthora sojae (strain P6497) TaxID=1094619 RepID=G4YSY9_PHYSP|nr:hypothetical protein PHYSODRAFT_311881 [Phytophthora sojae]EGZ25408.1 hypothetical protein PHYSODRAFT_311881 [Phytophthora sojae]|eukprot:XP_009520696.1 hypothetical protein PHYSODRAFT_311881 [Phytophthora sojae]
MKDVIRFPAPTDDAEWSALGFYDKSGAPSYNCLAAIDYRKKFCYLGVFSGSNSDQSMWNQSEVLGPRAREIFVAISNGAIWLTRNQRCFNYHLSSTRILVESVFGKWKAPFKVLHGVTDRRTHKRNARMICAAAVLHNLLIDICDNLKFKFVRTDKCRLLTCRK